MMLAHGCTTVGYFLHYRTVRRAIFAHHFIVIQQLSFDSRLQLINPSSVLSHDDDSCKYGKRHIFYSYDPRLCSFNKPYIYNLSNIKCSSIYACNREFGASSHWSGHSSAQNPYSVHDYLTNKKGSFGTRSPKARHLSPPAAVTSSSNNFPLSSFILPFAVCYRLDEKISRSAFTDLCTTAQFNL